MQWAAIDRWSEWMLLLVWGVTALRASRLLRAPVRSALRRRAGRVAGWMIVGTALLCAKAIVDARLWVIGEGDGLSALLAAAVAAASLAAAFRSAPRLLEVSRYAYDEYKAERAAATAPRTIVPIQATACGVAIAFGLARFESGLIVAAAGALLLGGLWALQRRRHAAARLDGWRRPKPLRAVLRTRAARAFASVR